MFDVAYAAMRLFTVCLRCSLPRSLSLSLCALCALEKLWIGFGENLWMDRRWDKDDVDKFRGTIPEKH